MGNADKQRPGPSRHDDQDWEVYPGERIHAERLWASARAMWANWRARWRIPLQSRPVIRWVMVVGTSKTRNPARNASIVSATSAPNPGAIPPTRSQTCLLIALWPDRGDIIVRPVRWRIPDRASPTAK